MDWFESVRKQIAEAKRQGYRATKVLLPKLILEEMLAELAENHQLRREKELRIEVRKISELKEGDSAGKIFGIPVEINRFMSLILEEV